MTLSNRTLVKIAAWGGVIVSATGFYLQHRLVDRVREYDYYKSAIMQLRMNKGAVFHLGEPIKDKRFKLTDPKNNYSDGKTARFSVPVSGPKDRGIYHFWAVRENDKWKLTQAELDLKSKPDIRYNKISIIMFVGTSKEKYFYHNTLLCLVKALQDKNITVDLRNDSYVCGSVSTVDGFMNISFTNAVYCDPQGNEFAFDDLFIQARNIRYVHIPEQMSIISTIKSEIIKEKREPPKKLKSRKVTKAIQQHMKTVASLDI